MTSGASVKRQVGSDPEEKGDRHPEDFYRTGPRATRALLAVERFPGIVWEPACGSGDMARELVAPEITNVIASDLYDRGYGRIGVDFLTGIAPVVDHVITNPPFNNVEAFLKRGLEVASGKVALIARLQWLEGARRKKTVFDVTPPSRVWVFPYRIPMARGDTPFAAGLIAFCWIVWEKDWDRPTQLGWLP